MGEGRAHVVPLGDILKFICETRWVMRQWEADPQQFAPQLQAARRFTSERYSPQNESSEIVGVWNEIFRIAQEKQQKQNAAAA